MVHVPVEDDGAAVLYIDCLLVVAAGMNVTCIGRFEVVQRFARRLGGISDLDLIF
jgi:hypothetical protein